MKWILVERKPDVIFSPASAMYLGAGDALTGNAASALAFETRELAEAHRRRLKRPYNWVTISVDD
jgi:hypothetical protein